MFTHRDGGSSEGQAEQHQQGDQLVRGLDVGEAQAAVAAAESHQHRLEEVAPLQEVETDHRRYQDGHLSSKEEQTEEKIRQQDNDGGKG